MSRRALALALWGALAGCVCVDPWVRFPEHAPPDHSYSTGGSTHGEDVYVWSCLRGRHRVVHQYSAEMTCRAPQEEETACGQLTPFETAIAGQPVLAARAGREWHP